LNKKADQPWTYLDKGLFLAAPRPGSDLSRWMLKLDNADDSYGAEKNLKNPFALVQVDPDGSSLKLIDYASNIRKQSAVKSYAEPQDAGVPSIRTGGIGVVRLGRAYKIATHFFDVASMNTKFTSLAPAPVYLYADDLLRGYRIDIKDETTGADWLSLCKRIGTYRLPGGSSAVQSIGTELSNIKDEGYVKSASASSDLKESPDLYLHETLFRWDGYSLVASRPGATIARQTSDPTQPPEVPAHVPNTAVTEFKIETRFRPEPGTLPRLRYGHEYRIRSRAVDLSGYSHDLKEAPKDPSLQSNKLKFRRFEPVVPPALVLRARLTPGESVEHLVIRSNFDASTGEYIALPAVLSALSGKDYTFAETNDRHVAPPKTSQLMAETHEKFDGAIGLGKDCDAVYNMSLKEEGTFLDTMIVNTSTGKKDIPVEGIELVTPASVNLSPAPPAPKPPTSLPLKPGESLAAGQYVIHTKELQLPYLPDPLAEGVAFRDLPRAATGEPENVIKVPFGGTWPDAKPFRILIREWPGKMDSSDAGDCVEKHASDEEGKPKWDDTTRVLTVPLAKGEMVRVRYSSYLNPSDLDKMGIIGWLAGSSKMGEMTKFAAAGIHWMVTPYRELLLVHAVQQPLCAPWIDTKIFDAKKGKVGDTFAMIRGNFHLSVRSTGRLDLLAEWEEPVDNLADPGPRKVTGNAHVFDMTIETTYTDNMPVPPPGYAGEPDKTFRHEFHDTKHRYVKYHLLGTTRFREYFPVAITQDPKNITREGKEREYRVLNSARPDAPKVLYVIPTFGWTPPENLGNEIVSRRCGGGLRVYMDRPWYSSGDEERLGVVLRSSGTGGIIKPRRTDLQINPGVLETKVNTSGTAKDSVSTSSASMKLVEKLKKFGGFGSSSDPEILKPFVTDWGMDPIWGSTPPKPSPAINDFTLADDTSRGGLSLAELEGVEFAVAAHEVYFDEKRGLWYCDITIDAGNSYTPFVRLALARYQPYSIPDCHLSRVVLADFAQLAPDRVAAVVFDGTNKVRVMVSGVHGVNQLTGKAFSPADPKTFKTLTYSRVFMVTLETQLAPGAIDADVTGSAGWGPVPGGEATVIMTPFQQVESRMIWSGEVTLPEAAKRMGGTRPFRLVIKEFEALRTDDDVKQLVLNDRAASFRLVYADVIEI
jgi:hypothetical protein